jgi:preprotein translocase subunit SecF
MTYSQSANLAVNQTLVRSINTSIIALLPIGAILFAGIVLLGSGPLKDLALALFVGVAIGAYSSIFIATPLAVQLKSNEKEITEQDSRARARARREVDRYASVPVFTDDLPVHDPDDESDPADVDDDDDDVAPTRQPRRPEASGSGRVVPTAKKPLRDSGSSGRTQPSRQPRSKRGK